MHDKHRNWVFIPKGNNWPHGLTELVVYSFLAYRSRYDTPPTILAISGNCGLSENAVRSSLDKLEASGLVLERIAQPPPADWFVEKPKNEDHWSFGFAGWFCYARTVNATITFAEVCLWSYLRHCKNTDFTPSAGWSYSFLSRTLCIGRDTVKDCLSRLDGRLLQYDGSSGKMDVKLYKTVPQSMLSAFRDKFHYQSQGAGEVEEIEAPDVAPEGNLALIRVVNPNHDPQFLRRMEINSQTEYDKFVGLSADLEEVYNLLVGYGFMEGHSETRGLAKELYLANGRQVEGIADVVASEKSKSGGDVGERIKAALRSKQQAV